MHSHSTGFPSPPPPLLSKDGALPDDFLLHILSWETQEQDDDASTCFPAHYTKLGGRRSGFQYLLELDLMDWPPSYGLLPDTVDPRDGTNVLTHGFSHGQGFRVEATGKILYGCFVYLDSIVVRSELFAARTSDHLSHASAVLAAHQKGK